MKKAHEIKITESNGKIAITSPYSKWFVRGVKGLDGARWNGAHWSVDAHELDNLIKLVDKCFEYYTISGIANIEKLPVSIATGGGLNEELDGEALAALNTPRGWWMS